MTNSLRDTVYLHNYVCQIFWRISDGSLSGADRIVTTIWYVRPVIDDVQSVGCDKQRAGTPNQRHGVPALPLVTPYKFTKWPAVVAACSYCAEMKGDAVEFPHVFRGRRGDGG